MDKATKEANREAAKKFVPKAAQDARHENENRRLQLKYEGKLRN